MLGSFTEPEDDNDILRRVRHSKGRPNMPLNDITTGSVINGTATSDLHATCRAEIERVSEAHRYCDETLRKQQARWAEEHAKNERLRGAIRWLVEGAGIEIDLPADGLAWDHNFAGYFHHASGEYGQPIPSKEKPLAEAVLDVLGNPGV